MTASALQRFRMSFEWKHREKKYDEPERPSSWPVMYLSLNAFLDEYEGTFSMHLDDTEVEFDLKWDLPIIFEYIPKEFEALVRSEGTSHYLCFAEQGTELAVDMMRSGQQVTIKFAPLSQYSIYSREFLSKEFHVSAAEFISEWVRFISTVLDAVVEFDPSVKEDTEVKTYIGRIEALRGAVKAGKVDPSALPEQAE